MPTRKIAFRRPNGGRLQFSVAAWEVLHACRQLTEASHEAGGILLGRMILGTDDVVVDEATVPGPGDLASRYHFRRLRKRSQALVTAAWQQSAGTRVYLGEWHSHPEPTPTPSWVDKCDQRRVLKRARFEQCFLFFAIVGTERTRVWEGLRGGDGIVELEQQA